METAVEYKKGSHSEVQEKPQNGVIATIEDQNLQTSIFSTDPEQAMEQMERLVKVMASKCTGVQFISNIKGKQYPKVEWWTTVGTPLGLFPMTEFSRKIERDGETIYEARVTVRRNGQIITAGEAICSSKEKNWKDRDEYAIKSMAITRATGKAYRIGLSMLAVMAGLEPTPAEEIPKDGFGNNKPPKFSREYRITFGKFGIGGESTAGEDINDGTMLKDLDNGYLNWLKLNANEDWLREFATKELEERTIDQSIREESKATGQTVKMTKKQNDEFNELIEHKVFTTVEQGKAYGWLKKTPTKADAKEKIDWCKSIIAKRAKPEIGLDDLIDYAIKEWMCTKTNAVVQLNMLVAGLYDIAVIDNLSTEQIKDLYEKLGEGKING